MVPPSGRPRHAIADVRVSGCGGRSRSNPHHTAYGDRAIPAPLLTVPARRARSAELAVSSAASAAATQGLRTRQKTTLHAVLRARLVPKALR